MTPWTDAQLSWFVSNYPTHGKRYCMDYLNKSEAQIRQRAWKLGLRQDRNSSFFKEWQTRAAKGKVGKKRPEQAEVMKRLHSQGKLTHYTHGLSYKRAYKTWRAMMSRCYNPENESYKRYGARGIAVCEEWHDVRNFTQWFDKQPPDVSIDRIDNNGNYEPSNCRLTNYSVQAQNRSSNVLQQEDVDAIRKLYAEIGNQREVARQTGFGYRLVHLVVRNKIWT